MLRESHVLAPKELRFEVKVAWPRDLDAVIGFFGGTVYEPQRIDERTVALTPPAAIDDSIARREVRVYLRLLQRLCPGLAADVVD
jgi:hypothetical protein